MDNQIPKSPVFAAGQQWETVKRDAVYESEVTRLVRRLRQEPSILADQRVAWERWRNDPTGLRR